MALRIIVVFTITLIIGAIIDTNLLPFVEGMYLAFIISLIIVGFVETAIGAAKVYTNGKRSW